MRSMRITASAISGALLTVCFLAASSAQAQQEIAQKGYAFKLGMLQPRQQDTRTFAGDMFLQATATYDLRQFSGGSGKTRVFAFADILAGTRAEEIGQIRGVTATMETTVRSLGLGVGARQYLARAFYVGGALGLYRSSTDVSGKAGEAEVSVADGSRTGLGWKALGGAEFSGGFFAELEYSSIPTTPLRLEGRTLIDLNPGGISLSVGRRF